MKLTSELHPIWRTINLVVVLSFLTGILYLNANNFDSTEFRSIIQMAFAVGGWEVVKGKLAKASGGDGE